MTLHKFCPVCGKGERPSRCHARRKTQRFGRNGDNGQAMSDSSCFYDADLEGRGRGLVANRDIAAGESVMVELSVATVVLENWKTKVCHQCFRLSQQLNGCPLCREVAWCSEDCRQEAAELHGDGRPGTECKALQTMDTTMLRDADVSLAKLFLLLLCRRANADPSKSKVKYDEFLFGLVSNEEAIPSDRRSELSIVAEIVLDALPPTATIDEDDLLRFMCAEQCNSFGIWGDRGACKGKLVGFGLFPRLCLFNHNCLPNITVSQEVYNNHRTLTAHALCPIPRGKELCISYSDSSLLDNGSKRKAWLEKHYLFLCDCALCNAQGDEAKEMIHHFNRSFRCMESKCGGLIFPRFIEGRSVLECGTCHHQRPAAET